MNKIQILGALAVLGFAATSCDHFLDENRYPLTSQINNKEYWSNASNIETQTNYLYESYLGYGNGTGSGTFYFTNLNDDQTVTGVTPWTNTNVPSASTNWSSPYTEIRRCCLILQGIEEAGDALSASNAANYSGIARLNRAFQYYQLVKCYGDVPLITKALDPADTEEIYGARVDRDKVMDFVLEDLDYAIENISAQSGKQVWSKDLAMAMKAEICLYEGTYCKYRTTAENGKAADETRANKYLNEVVNACSPLMESYSLSSSYAANYRSVLSLMNQNPEMIFFKGYEKDVFMNSVVDYTCSSTQINGITKDAFNAFLFKDGLPKALTTYDTSEVGIVKYIGKRALTADDDPEQIENLDGYTWDARWYYIGDLLERRDARLSVLTDTVAYYQLMSWSRAGAHQMTSSTGYGCAKFDDISIPVAYRPEGNKNYVCAPLYWLSKIYCEYAEAKAELGTITQNDLDNSINKLYARAELPDLQLANIFHDPANNMGASDIIWEVRRCRRCELLFDGFRYWDLVRWHQLDKLDTMQYPDIQYGANVTAEGCQPISNVDGYIDSKNGNERLYDKKYYFYPIPSSQINLYSTAGYELTQNPGW